MKWLTATCLLMLVLCSGELYWVKQVANDVAGDAFSWDLVEQAYPSSMIIEGNISAGSGGSDCAGIFFLGKNGLPLADPRGRNGRHLNLRIWACGAKYFNAEWTDPRDGKLVVQALLRNPAKDHYFLLCCGKIQPDLYRQALQGELP